MFYWVLLAASLLTLEVWADCRNGWLRHGTTCYHFSHDKEPWIGAVLVCERLGGHIATITDKVEGDFLSNETKLFRRDFWIGGNDMAVEGEWMWDTPSEKGQSFNSNDLITHQSYQNWSPGNPSNSNGNENCMEINSDASGKWNDDECTKAQYYICEAESGDSGQILG